MIAARSTDVGSRPFSFPEQGELVDNGTIDLGGPFRESVHEHFRNTGISAWPFTMSPNTTPNRWVTSARSTL